MVADLTATNPNPFGSSEVENRFALRFSTSLEANGYSIP